MSFRAFYILAAFSTGLVISYFAAPLAYQNKDVINALITTFTVFGGFLVGVITLTGANSQGATNWRSAESRRNRVDGPLARQRALFYLYLLVLTFLIASLLIIEPAGNEKISACAKLWTTRIFLAFAVFAIILTFALPHMIVSAQKANLDEEIERRRDHDAIEATQIRADNHQDDT